MACNHARDVAVKMEIGCSKATADLAALLSTFIPLAILTAIKKKPKTTRPLIPMLIKLRSLVELKFPPANIKASIGLYLSQASSSRVKVPIPCILVDKRLMMEESKTNVGIVVEIDTIVIERLEMDSNVIAS